MLNYIRVENLKMKRTNVRKSLLLLPVAIGILLCGIAPSHINYNGYNWWYAIMIPIISGVIGVSVASKDKKKFNYKGLGKYNISYPKVWIGKIVVAIEYLAFANLSMFAVLEISERIIGNQIKDIGIVLGGESMLASLMCSIWLIPLAMIIYEIFGRTVTYITIFFGSIGGLIIAPKSYWWMNPFSWCSRVQAPILGILPNGLVAEEGNKIMDVSAIPIGISLSLLGMVICTVVLLRVMRRRSENA